MNNIVERLKICYFVLTKKYYAFFAISRIVYKHSGARCFISDNAEKSHVFMNSLNKYSKTLLGNFEFDEKTNKYVYNGEITKKEKSKR